MQLGRDFPRILRKEIEHICAIRSLSACTDLSVALEDSKCGISHIESRTGWIQFGKLELTVLVVGLSGDSVLAGDLVVVVVLGALIQHAGAQGVVAEDVGKGIGVVEDSSLRVRGIGAAVHCGYGAFVELNCWDFVRKVLTIGEEEGIVDAIA